MGLLKCAYLHGDVALPEAPKAMAALREYRTGNIARGLASRGK